MAYSCFGIFMLRISVEFGICLYTIFWESIQVLLREVIKIVFEMAFEKICFCALTLLFCAPPGIR